MKDIIKKLITSTGIVNGIFKLIVNYLSNETVEDDEKIVSYEFEDTKRYFIENHCKNQMIVRDIRQIDSDKILVTFISNNKIKLRFRGCDRPMELLEIF